MGRLRALNGAISRENITTEHIDPFKGVVDSLSAMLRKSHSSILVKLRRRRFFLFSSSS